MNITITFEGAQYVNWQHEDLINAGVPQPVVLAAAVKQLREAIDHAAGQARARHITTSPGQESTYIAKGQEAERFIADGSPADTTPFVMLTAEAGALGITVADLADQVIATRAAWLQLAGAVEAARLGGKAAVEGAETIAAAEAAAAAAIEALDAI